jgi:hypothetical protein
MKIFHQPLNVTERQQLLLQSTALKLKEVFSIMNYIVTKERNAHSACLTFDEDQTSGNIFTILVISWQWILTLD